MEFKTEVKELMDREGIGARLLFGGGIIPGSDIETLQQAGVAKLFGPGTPVPEIVEYCRSGNMSTIVEQCGNDVVEVVDGLMGRSSAPPR